MSGVQHRSDAPIHLVFDFGAVVLQWRPAEVVARHFPEHCLTDAAARAFAGNVFASADWHAFDAGRVEPDVTAQRLAARLHLAIDRVQDMIACIDDHLQPIESTVALIEALHLHRGPGSPTRLHFLSNMPRLYARGIEARHAFMRCFDNGIFSGDVRLAKPDDAIYALAESRFGVSEPRQILFVDDHPDNIAAARRRGWQTHLVSDVNTLNEVFAFALPR